MSLSLAGVLADARSLWRSERELLVPIAGVFYFLPMLGAVLLLANAGFAEIGPDAGPNKLREAVEAFIAANLLPIVFISLAVDFGTFAVFNLYLQGAGRTLGEVLGLTARRFLPFLAMEIIARALFSFGSSLFVLPGLFALGRTWLAGPAYAAAPAQGPFAAFREGWRCSGGFRWITLLVANGLVLFGAALLLLLANALLGLVAVLIGNVQVAAVMSYVVSALGIALTLTIFALLRVAAYRRTEPSTGM